MPEYTEQVTNNTEKHQFQVVSGSQVSKLVYRMEGGKLALVHTEVPEELSGQGIGSALVKYALNYARDNQLVVLPYCPFVASYVARHSEWDDIVEPV